MAVIVGREEDGAPIMKSVSYPPTREEERLAEELDELLKERIPQIERELVSEGLTSGKGRGSLELWYRLGEKLQGIADDERVVKPAERHWLWQAIRMYASDLILRKDRGPFRIHFDYCYRISKIPRDCLEGFSWDDWVFLFDSKCFREDPRTDEWLRQRAREISSLSRSELRAFVRRANAILKKNDTSVLSREELFAQLDHILASN